MTTHVDVPASKYDVVDAHGNYHDVSKSAFDSTSLDGQFKSLVERGGKWMHEHFSETFSRLQESRRQAVGRLRLEPQARGAQDREPGGWSLCRQGRWDCGGHDRHP